MSQGNKPCLTLPGDGGVQLSIWKNRKDGKEWFSYVLSRRYTTDDGATWKTTYNLGKRNLLIGAKLLERAHELTAKQPFGPGLSAPAAEFGGGGADDATPDDGDGEDKPF